MQGISKSENQEKATTGMQSVQMGAKAENISQEKKMECEICGKTFPNIHILDLGLPVATAIALQWPRIIETTDDLLRAAPTWKDLAKWPGIGNRRIGHIIERLNHFGIPHQYWR